MTFAHPKDLPLLWFERWEERAAIVSEGNNMPTDREGNASANRLAFEMILADMEREKP